MRPPRTYLVTGGCGFIGSHLADALLKAGHKVRVVDNLFSGKKENLSPKAEFIQGDIRDEALMKKAVTGVDGCFHLAAIASVQLSQSQWRETHSVNVTGAITLFEAIKNSGQPTPVVFASSAAVYGDNPDIPLSEDSQPMPITPYGADKLACESHARAAFRCHGIPGIGFRLFNVYGPRQDPNSPYSGVISIFIGKHQKNEPITIYGDGQQVRDFIYVADVVKCLTEGMARIQPGTFEILNVGTGKQTSINQLANVITKATGNNVPRQQKPHQVGDIRISACRNDMLNEFLGFVPSTALEEGIKKTLAG